MVRYSEKRYRIQGPFPYVNTAYTVVTHLDLHRRGDSDRGYVLGNSVCHSKHSQSRSSHPRRPHGPVDVLLYALHFQRRRLCLNLDESRKKRTKTSNHWWKIATKYMWTRWTGLWSFQCVHKSLWEGLAVRPSVREKRSDMVGNELENSQRLNGQK